MVCWTLAPVFFVFSNRADREEFRQKFLNNEQSVRLRPFRMQFCFHIPTICCHHCLSWISTGFHLLCDVVR